MTAKIAERTIHAIVSDLERTFYSAEEANRIFGPARRQLAIALLVQSGSTEKLSEDVISAKVDELTALTDTISWSHAYFQLGGDLDFFHKTVRGIDRSHGLKHNPGLRRMLVDLRNKVKLGLLTKATVPTAEAICAKILGHEWQGLFDAVVCDGTPGCPAEKPDPRAFEFILNQLGVSPEQAAMVGDNLADDILPAAALGMLTIYVGDQRGIGDLRISRIEELQALIDLSR
jgi:HAD superfamily hydrolase (TIGR01549 family)